MGIGQGESRGSGVENAGDAFGVDGVRLGRVGFCAMIPAWRSVGGRVRPWLILGRVSNLPTVWSNVLAAWLLSGGWSWGRLGWVLVGGSLVYVGGMYLNDACDVEFDRVHRRERPIPSGQAGLGAVWVVGVGMLLVGWLCLAPLGVVGVVGGGLLVVAVLVYDVVHKSVSYGPVLMALCRFLLFVVAGSTAAEGLVGEVVWSGLVLGMYIVGVSHIARRESVGGVLAYWPLALMAAPVVLAGFMNPPATWGLTDVLMPVVLFLLWTMRCLSRLWRLGVREGAREAVPGLLAGIVWVDVVAVIPGVWPMGAVFVGLFVVTLAFQRVVPAS